MLKLISIFLEQEELTDILHQAVVIEMGTGVTECIKPQVRNIGHSKRGSI